MKKVPKHLRSVLIVSLVVFLGLAGRKYAVINSDSGHGVVVVSAFWNTLQSRFFYTMYTGMGRFEVPSERLATSESNIR